MYSALLTCSEYPFHYSLICALYLSTFGLTRLALVSCRTGRLHSSCEANASVRHPWLGSLLVRRQTSSLASPSRCRTLRGHHNAIPCTYTSGAVTESERVRRGVPWPGYVAATLQRPFTMPKSYSTARMSTRESDSCPVCPDEDPLADSAWQPRAATCDGIHDHERGRPALRTVTTIARGGNGPGVSVHTCTTVAWPRVLSEAQMGSPRPPVCWYAHTSSRAPARGHARTLLPVPCRAHMLLPYRTLARLPRRATDSLGNIGALQSNCLLGTRGTRRMHLSLRGELSHQLSVHSTLHASSEFGSH